MVIMGSVVLGIIVFGLVGYFLLMYIEGNYSVSSSEIIKEGEVVDSQGRIVERYYYIKTTYESGRIKITKKSV
jgi:hypothetical protein